MYNIVSEQIHNILVNLVRTYNIKRTYIDKDDQKSVILKVTAFAIITKEKKLKCYSAVKLLFCRDIILLKKYTVDN